MTSRNYYCDPLVTCWWSLPITAFSSVWVCRSRTCQANFRNGSHPRYDRRRQSGFAETFEELRKRGLGEQPSPVFVHHTGWGHLGEVQVDPLSLYFLAFLLFLDCTYNSLSVILWFDWLYLIILAFVYRIFLFAHGTFVPDDNRCTWCLKASSSLRFASFLCSSSTTWLSSSSFWPSLHFTWNVLDHLNLVCCVTTTTILS